MSLLSLTVPTEKTQKTLGGGGGGGGKDERSSGTKVGKVVVSEALDELTRAELEEFKHFVAGAQALHLRLTTHAQKVKELAVVSSNFSGDCHKLLPVENEATQQLKQACLAWVKLNRLGEELELLARDVKGLETLEFVPCSSLADKVAKRAKAVEHMRKKNDANTLTEERGLHEDVERLRGSLASCRGKYRELVQRVAAAWVSLSCGAAEVLLRDLSACTAVEVQAPPHL